MTARDIVRDPNILSGRWRFDGTSIAIADVLNDHGADLEDAETKYRFAGLNDEDIQAAMTFVFPDVRTTQVNLEYAAVVVSCACGEDTYKSGLTPAVSIVECACRRTWKITVEHLLDREDRPGARPNGG